MTSTNVEKILSECFADGLLVKPINYKGMFILENYADIAESVENFEVRDDDTWVCTFPKTGTTWTEEIVSSILFNTDSGAESVPRDRKFQYLERSGTTSLGCVAARKLNASSASHDFLTNSVKCVADAPSPRFIKTHLPFHLLPRQLRSGEKKNKIIYVMRDPKDVCISFYHLYKLTEGYIGNFENFIELFLHDKVYYAPFWEHVIGFWKTKDSRDILFLKYEDMKADLGAAIKQTAAFLGKTLDDKQARELEEPLSFASMKANPRMNKEWLSKMINETKMYGSNFVSQGEFTRKGTAGQWKTEMSSEMINRFDRWTDEKLKDWPELRKEFS